MVNASIVLLKSHGIVDLAATSGAKGAKGPDFNPSYIQRLSPLENKVAGRIFETEVI